MQQKAFNESRLSLKAKRLEIIELNTSHCFLEINPTVNDKCRYHCKHLLIASFIPVNRNNT